MSADLRLGRWQDVLADDPADGSVRLILTSPPYDNARTYEGTNEPVDFGELAAWALRKLMPGGTLAMVIDAPMKDGRQSVTPYRVICEWAALEGWQFRQFLVYGRQGQPGHWNGWFRRDHEPLLVFVRDGGEQVCAKERVATRASVNTSITASRTSHRNSSGSMVTKNRTPGDTVYRGSIWSYGNIGPCSDPSSGQGHPATFAEAFARDAVDVWSNPGDLVVDPFAGSATVGRACEDLGRRFIGAERVPKYHAIGQARLAQRGLFQVAS